jgi:hypothetical protein
MRSLSEADKLIENGFLKPTRDLYYKTFYGCNFYCIVMSSVSVRSIYFQPRLIFEGKARSLPLKSSHIMGSTLASSSPKIILPTLYDSTVMVGSWPCPKILDEAGSKWIEQTL